MNTYMVVHRALELKWETTRIDSFDLAAPHLTRNRAIGSIHLASHMRTCRR